MNTYVSIYDSDLFNSYSEFKIVQPGLQSMEPDCELIKVTPRQNWLFSDRFVLNSELSLLIRFSGTGTFWELLIEFKIKPCTLSVDRKISQLKRPWVTV